MDKRLRESSQGAKLVSRNPEWEVWKPQTYEDMRELGSETIQIRRAKRVLESKGYSVSKRSKRLKEGETSSLATNDIYQLLVGKLKSSTFQTISSSKYNTKEYGSIFINFRSGVAFTGDMHSLEESIDFLEESISYIENLGFHLDEEPEIPEYDNSGNYDVSLDYSLSRGEETIDVRATIYMYHNSQIFTSYAEIRVYSEELYTLLLAKEEEKTKKDKDRRDKAYSKKLAGRSFFDVLRGYERAGMLLREVIETIEMDEKIEDDPIAQVASKLGGTIDNIYMFTPEDGGKSAEAYYWIVESAERSGKKELSNFSKFREPWVLYTSEATGDYVAHASYGYYEIYIKIDN